MACLTGFTHAMSSDDKSKRAPVRSINISAFVATATTTATDTAAVTATTGFKIGTND